MVKELQKEYNNKNYEGAEDVIERLVYQTEQNQKFIESVLFKILSFRLKMKLKLRMKKRLLILEKILMNSFLKKALTKIHLVHFNFSFVEPNSQRASIGRHSKTFSMDETLEISFRWNYSYILNVLQTYIVANKIDIDAALEKVTNKKNKFVNTIIFTRFILEIKR